MSFAEPSLAGNETNRPPATQTTPDAAASQREAGRQLKIQLNEALSQKAPRLVVKPGIYRLSPDSPDLAHLVFKNISNFELIADGVTLICETKNSAIVMERCTNVKISGATIDYDPLPMTQGAITAVSPDSLDFKINAGYDALDYDGIGVGHIWIVDAATWQVKPGSMNYGHPKQIIKTGEDTYRLMTRGERHDSVAVGDLIKFPQKLNLKSPHAIRVYGCKSTTFENVTIESAPCFGFVSSWGDGIVLDNVRVTPGPPPPGATEPRIFSSSADGINLENDRRGPVIRNCIVASNGDDGIAIYNSPDTVLAQDNASVVIDLNWPDPKIKSYSPGDTLRFFLYQAHRTEERKIVSVEPGPPESESGQSGATLKAHGSPHGRTVKVVLDSPLPVSPGDRVLDTQYAGHDFEISNNVLVNNASRGINVNQSCGSVFHNYIRHSFLPGIHMTEFMGTDAGGSGFQTSVRIRDNIITDACIGYPRRKDWQGAISIVAWDAAAHFLDGHSDIAITGNVIDKPNGIGIQVSCASKVTIEDNVFGSLDKVGNAGEGIDAPALLLDEVYGANIHRNILAGAGWSAAETELKVMPSCKGISSELPVVPIPH